MAEQVDVRSMLIHALVRRLVQDQDIRPEDIAVAERHMLGADVIEWGVVAMAAQVQSEMCLSVEESMRLLADRAQAGHHPQDAEMYRRAAQQAGDAFAAWYSLEQALKGPEGADPQFTRALKAEIARRAQQKSR